MRVVTGIEPELRRAVPCRREAGAARALARLVVRGLLAGDEETMTTLRDTRLGLVSSSLSVVDRGITGRSRLEGSRGPLRRYDEVLVSAQRRGAVAYQHFCALGFSSHRRPLLPPARIRSDDAGTLAGGSRVH